MEYRIGDWLRSRANGVWFVVEDVQLPFVMIERRRYNIAIFADCVGVMTMGGRVVVQDR